MSNLTTSQLLAMLEEQVRKNPDLTPTGEIVQEIEKRNRFGYMLKMHHEIECENDWKWHRFRECQQGT